MGACQAAASEQARDYWLRLKANREDQVGSGQDRSAAMRPRPSLRSQIVTTMKLLGITVTFMIVLWYLDRMLAG